MREMGGLSGIDPKELFGVAIELMMKLIPRGVSQLGDESRSETGHPRFTGAGAAMRVWGEERGIGFDHDAVGGDEARRGLDFGCVFVRHYAGEGDGCPEVKYLSGIVNGTGEAVEDKTVAWECGSGEDGNEIIKGFAAVDDDGFGQAFTSTGFDEGQLRFENLSLGGG